MFKDVVIVGVGNTKSTKDYGRGKTDMMIDAGLQALVYADIRRNDLSKIYVAGGREVAEDKGVIERMIKSNADVHIIGYDECSGLEALEVAARDIESGQIDYAMVCGATKLSKIGTSFPDSKDDRGNLSNYHGATQLVKLKWAAQSYKSEGITKESLALVPVKAHLYGSKNSHAFFQKPLKYSIVLKTMKDDELGPFEIQPDECDGAAAVILTNKKSLAGNVMIKDFGYASVPEVNSKKRHEMPFIAESFKKAISRSGVRKEEISVMEIHDSITPLEPIILNQLEMFGISETNEILSRSFMDHFKDGVKPPVNLPYQLSEPLYVNTRGGHKAAGYPFGAGDLEKIIEVFYQLSKKAGPRQIDRTGFGVVQSMNQLRSSMVGVLGYE